LFNVVGAVLVVFIAAFNGQFYMREVLLAAGAKYSIGHESTSTTKTTKEKEKAKTK
jgi:hypothetical protein